MLRGEVRFCQVRLRYVRLVWITVRDIPALGLAEHLQFTLVSDSYILIILLDRYRLYNNIMRTK